MGRKSWPTTASTSVEILDETGRPVAQGEKGEVFVRKRFAPDWECLGHEKECYGDGLASVGDIGYLDPDGYLMLCDRKGETIISGGVNVYPAEIEAVVIAHPKILDCAVFGASDEDLGEKIVAAVTLLDGAAADEQEIQSYVRERLASYKVPRVVDFHAELPRLESGKVLRRRLRDAYWHRNDRAI